MATPKKSTKKKPALKKATKEQIIEATDKARPLDGSKNNVNHCEWGSAGSILMRVTPPSGEGPHHTTLPAHKRVLHNDPLNPRKISNLVCREYAPEVDPVGRTHWMWAWGQFLDHQLDLTLESEEVIPVEVSPDDPHLSPDSDGLTIKFKRSAVAAGTGTRYDTPREHANVLSSYIDGSSVYGNDAERLAELIDAGTGQLKEGPGGLLPKRPAATDVANAEPGDFGAAGTFFMAGDLRVNEHAVLTSLHTMFVRLHNLRVDTLVSAGETDPVVLFTKARAWVAAVMQSITYNEFVPELLGTRSVRGEWAYHGYNDTVETTICSEFSTAAYRLGHSMLPVSIPVTGPVEFSTTGADGTERLDIKDAFFKPELLELHGISTFVGLLHTEEMRKIDGRVAEGLRSFLFRFPSGPGTTDLNLLDLAALNIMRGRDHRLGYYNDVREGLGMARKTTFAEITEDPDMAWRLEAAYGDVDLIDLWIGGLCEQPTADAAVGETFYAILHDQFMRLRDGDRWHWQNDDYPRFGEHIVCKPHCCCCKEDTGPVGDPVLSEHERHEISQGKWTLAKVLIETNAVGSNALTATTNVFNLSGAHKVEFMADDAKHDEPSCDVSRQSPGYRSN